MRALPIIWLAVLLLASCAKAPVSAPVEDIRNQPVVDVPTDVPTEEPELSVDRPEFHQVKKGETLTSIALNYGLEYLELARWNDMRNPDIIQVGQRIRLSPPKDDPVVSIVAPQQSIEIEESAVVPPAKDVSAPSLPRRQTTVIGDELPSLSQPLLSNIPLKSKPLAAKYIYSPNVMERLLRQWGSKTVEKVPVETPIELPQVSLTVATTGSANGGSDSVPTKVRQRFDVEWGWPTKGKIINQFDEISKGINFSGSVGDAVYASADGKVIYVGTGVKSYGLLIIIKHNNDYLTAYAHNEKVLVKEGISVRRGSKIAVFGSTGTDRTMLHFEVRKVGKPFDPLQVLPPSP